MFTGKNLECLGFTLKSSRRRREEGQGGANQLEDYKVFT